MSKSAYVVGKTTIIVERPFTQEEILEKFKNNIKKAGGDIYKSAPNEIKISGLSENIYLPIIKEYIADFKKAVNPINEELRQYGKKIGINHSFVDSIVNSSSNVTIKEKFIKDKDYIIEKINIDSWVFDTRFNFYLINKTVHLVGQHYLNEKNNLVLKNKRVTHKALLVPEYDNVFDGNTILVLMWDIYDKKWYHVGYVRATEAVNLRCFLLKERNSAFVAQISHYPNTPDGHKEGNNIELTLTGEIRIYPSLLT